MSALAADRAEIGRFYGAMYLRADSGGFVSLRTFEHEPGRPAVEIRAVEINGEGLDPVIAQATGAANRAACYPRPAVFAPPVCTFKTAASGAEANLFNGLCITFEGDEQPVVAGTRLEGIIGPATVIVASGGKWTDPATGEVQDKRHQYWRLREPTRTAEEHAKLKRCNRLVAALVGGDPSAVPLVHPLGCPGSVHRKAEPRMRRLVELRDHVEIDLGDALDRLEQAAMLALEHATGDAAAHLRLALELRDKARIGTDAIDHDPDARDEDLDALADALPNNNAPRAEWIAIGLAFYAGSDGSPAGFNAWDRWARKAVDKYHGGTARQWQRFAKSPPDRTGTGALVNRARRHDPSFRLPSWEQAAEHGEQIAEDLLRGERAKTGNADDSDDKASRADSDKRTSNGDTSWPEPDLSIVEPHRAPPPPLPLPVFGPRWASWIADAAAAKGAPADFVAAPLLAAAGGMIALQRRASPWAGWTEPPVLWVADVGNPSSGKSPAIDAVADILRTLEVEVNDDFDDRLRQWKTDKLEAEVRKAIWESEAKEAVKKGYKPPLMPDNCEEPEPPHQRRLLINDVTPEKLVRLAAVNPYGLVLQRDELAGWLGGMDRYSGSGSERALWLEAFGARPFVLDRVKDAKPIRADALAVCIVGGIQPDRLATLVLAGDDDGLAARILYIWPETGPPRRPERGADDAFAREALRRLAKLDPGPDGPLVLPLTSAAADELQQWRVDLAAMESDAAGLFMSWLGKLPGVAVRIALVLEHLWWAGDRPNEAAPTVVSEEATLAAIGFLESYAIPMAKRSFGDATWPRAERDAAALGRWILAQKPLPKVVNARTLRRTSALHTREAPRYDAALAELEDANWVRPQSSRGSGKGGRPSKDWAVNPCLGASRG